MQLRHVKQAVRRLTFDQMLKLDSWLHGLIDDAKIIREPNASSHKVTLEVQRVSKTYRLEGIRCGKDNCKCARGELHGPYWYAYWSEGGKTKSQYIGKHLPKSQEKSRRRGV